MISLTLCQKICSPNCTIVKSYDISVFTSFLGQKFAFCGGHNGHDTCQNCPEGYSHKDFINTAHFKYKIDPCVKEEECSDYCKFIFLEI